MTFMTIYYESELYHHGVKGMKWGHRKTYAQKASEHVSKIGTSKTQLGKNYHNYRAYRNDARNRQSKAMSKDKGLIATVDNLAGQGHYAALRGASASYYNRKVGYAKNARKAQYAKSAAYNAKQLENYNNKQHTLTIQKASVKNAKQYVKNAVDLYSSTNFKTAAGRNTTLGKQYVDYMLTGGVGSMMADAIYRRRNK